MSSGLEPMPPRPPGPPRPARCGGAGVSCGAGDPGAASAALSPASPPGFRPVAIAVWMNILSFQMIGVDEPPPGIGTFHLTFFDSLHSTGGCAAGATPILSGPRHSGQLRSAWLTFGAAAVALEAINQTQQAKNCANEIARTNL